MDNFKSLQEINDSLRPCPLCGQKVHLNTLRQFADGHVKAEIMCSCGLYADLIWNPSDILMIEGDERNRLLPWDQWNNRYDDAMATEIASDKEQRAEKDIKEALKICTSEHQGCEDDCPYADKK